MKLVTVLILLSVLIALISFPEFTTERDRPISYAVLLR